MMIRITSNKFIAFKQFITALLILTCLLIPLTFERQVSASIDSPKVYDYYELFSEQEKEELEEILNQYTLEGEVDIVVLTTDNLEGKSKQKYMEDFFDNAYLGYDKELGDTVLLMLYMNPNDRSVEIQGYENSRFYITDDRIESILDEIVPYLSNGDYLKALEEYASLVANYMNTEVTAPNNNYSNNNNNNSYPSRQDSYDSSTSYPSRSEDILRNPLVQLGASLILSGIVVGIMAYHSSGRITTNNRTYLNQQESKVTAHHDIYIRTTVSRVRKPQNNDNGGGHTGGGTSSGGHSHSGGGRSF